MEMNSYLEEVSSEKTKSTLNFSFQQVYKYSLALEVKALTTSVNPQTKILDTSLTLLELK